ncbi:hypothetical protein BGW80DRAFT_149274 [Lactifluus volemus]|nr:hypothetical protein BGW80DRAFT_149274 [Lactifluus volemus]
MISQRRRSTRTFTSYGRSRLLTLAVHRSSSLEEPVSPPPNGITPELNSASHLELFALLRKSHVVVLCRHANELYTLVTDHRFLNHSGVVWQRLLETDGRAEYFDSAFRHVHPDVEDFKGHFDGNFLGKENHHHHEHRFSKFVSSTKHKVEHLFKSHHESHHTTIMIPLGGVTKWRQFDDPRRGGCC